MEALAAERKQGRRLILIRGKKCSSLEHPKRIAYPTEVEGLATQLLKVQDNIPICASIISQRLAFHSLEVGPEWVHERAKELVKNREIVVEALSPLGEGAVQGGEGAIYLWATLPEKYVDDVKVVHWLANRHGVVVVPGTACGSPGHLRISFGGLMEDDCRACCREAEKRITRIGERWNYAVTVFHI